MQKNKIDSPHLLKTIKQVAVTRSSEFEGGGQWWGSELHTSCYYVGCPRTHLLPAGFLRQSCQHIPLLETSCLKSAWSLLLDQWLSGMVVSYIHSSPCSSKNLVMLLLCLLLFSCSVVSDSFETPWTVSLPGFSVHEIFQPRILEWVAISFSRRSWPRD